MLLSTESVFALRAEDDLDMVQFCIVFAAPGSLVSSCVLVSVGIFGCSSCILVGFLFQVLLVASKKKNPPKNMPVAKLATLKCP